MIVCEYCRIAEGENSLSDPSKRCFFFDFEKIWPILRQPWGG
jgi:hypothetical protein